MAKHLILALACLCVLTHEVLGLTNGGRSRFDGSSYRKRVGPYHLDPSHLAPGTTDDGEPFLNIRRSTRATFPVFHLPLNDSDPYGLIDYAESVVFILIYSVNQTTDAPSRTRLYRGTRYGEQIDSINGQLDPTDPSPVLSTNFYVSDEDPNIVAFPHATLGQMYLSHDRGLTFDKVVFSPSTITTSTLSWYPLEHDWVLGQDTLNQRLYVSNNTGISWTLLANDVADFAWGDPSIDPPHTVYYSVNDSVAGGGATVRLYSQQPPFSPQAHLEFDPTLGRFNSFTLAGHYIFAEAVNSSGEHMVYVSYKRKQFQMANFPPTHVDRYKFYDVNNVQALALLEDEDGQLNLYTSDSTGVYYTLSLEDVVYNTYSYDFDGIYGVNGTFVANQYVRSAPSEARSVIRTVITFNNGGQWSPIKAPSVDCLGQTISCSFPGCSLHLFMDTSYYNTLGVYSHSSAPGLIAAHGTYGQYRGSVPDLYMSRDGGLTWFSTNEGLTWKYFRFASRNVIIYGVIVDPLEVTADVCLFGVEDTSYSWVVWNVDLQSVFPRQCVQSDYYTWRAGCRLGNELSIQRRLGNASCLNGPAYSPTKSSSNCSCSLADYQCAFGYKMSKYPTSPAGSCTRDTAVVTQSQTGSGYQKIPGDLCSGDFNFNYLGESADNSSVAVAVSVIVILAVVVIAVVIVLGLFALFRVGRRRGARTSSAESHGTAETITSDGFVVNSDKQKMMKDV
eukprot:Em0012g561a